MRSSNNNYHWPQPDIRDCFTDSAEMSFRGIASGHRVKWSIQVRRWVNLWLTGHGLTRSIWTWLNRVSGVLNVPRGARICLCTFDFWQDTQERVQAVISRLIFGQKNLAEISFTVALGPGCAKWCRVSKIALRWVIGTKGWGASVEVSQMICVSAVGTGRYANMQVANSCDDRSKVSRRGWFKAICRKSISEGEKRELIGRRDKASAAAFGSLEICRISFVNCETRSKWRVSRGEYLSGLERSAKVSGRWSV